MSTNEEVADVIEQAVDLIETVGWIQGHAWTTEFDPTAVGSTRVVGYCASGAFWVAAGRQEKADSGLFKGAMNAMNWEIGASVIDLYFPETTEWNDQEGRTKFEVIDMMRRAAKTLRNEASPA